MKKSFVVLLVLFTVLSTLKLSDKSIESKVFTPCIINIEADRVRKAGEADKCMSGVCLDKEYSFKNIQDFENKTGTQNDVYITQMYGDDKFPAQFVLECISKGKMPLIIIDRTVSDTETVAKSINSVAPHSFIALNCGTDMAEYNKKAAVIRKYAKSAIIMWDINTENDITACPNEEYVDWIMLNINDGNWDLNKLRNDIKYFEDFPVAVNISVQCFSSDNHKYYTDRWINMVNDAYRSASEYENTALVSYVSNSGANREYGSSNISDSEILRAGYKNAVERLCPKRKWNSTDEVAYISNNTAYIPISSADKLNIDKRYINSKYAVTKNFDIDNSGRKMFVYSGKM